MKNKITNIDEGKKSMSDDKKSEKKEPDRLAMMARAIEQKYDFNHDSLFVKNFSCFYIPEQKVKSKFCVEFNMAQLRAIKAKVDILMAEQDELLLFHRISEKKLRDEKNEKRIKDKKKGSGMLSIFNSKDK